MCRPTYYQVEYQINPWMKVGSVDQTIALQQWQKLVRLYQSLGAKVDIIDQQPGSPDMVFAADQAIVCGKSRLLLSSFRYQERRAETVYYQAWYAQHGYDIITLPPDIYLEGGGETQTWRNYLFIGTGFRASKSIARVIQQLIDKEVMSLELVDDRFYHLDTCLFVLDDQTVFYYPPAFSKNSVTTLKQLVPQLIEFNLEDVLQFAPNSVVVDSTVVIQTGNEAFANAVLGLGYTPRFIDVGEFIKAGGGAHCLTGQL
jgi:N-dimethylarginine dimethylaminohydrolase